MLTPLPLTPPEITSSQKIPPLNPPFLRGQGDVWRRGKCEAGSVEGGGSRFFGGIGWAWVAGRGKDSGLGAKPGGFVGCSRNSGGKSGSGRAHFGTLWAGKYPRLLGRRWMQQRNRNSRRFRHHLSLFCRNYDKSICHISGGTVFNVFDGLDYPGAGKGSLFQTGKPHSLFPSLYPVNKLIFKPSLLNHQEAAW